MSSHNVTLEGVQDTSGMSVRKKRAAVSCRSSAEGTLQDSGDEDTTFSQVTSTQAQRARENFTVEQMDHKAAEVVQFILIKDQKKLPVRRADIVKHVMKEYKLIYGDVMSRVCRVFEQVFGFKLVEIDPKQHVYVLVNKLEPLPSAELSACCGDPKTGLLFVLLAVVFMKGGVVKESLAWSTLKKLRLDPGAKHEEFGDVKKVVTEEFVRQKYLEYTKVPHTEPVEYELRWGPRAEKEVSKLKLIEFVAEVCFLFSSWPTPVRAPMSRASEGCFTCEVPQGSLPGPLLFINDCFPRSAVRIPTQEQQNVCAARSVPRSVKTPLLFERDPRSWTQQFRVASEVGTSSQGT
ncbi:hypothetical protein DNTS_017288 [Danionella cerebrum]|uniref:MAGE domain-containing protein n=1 Tax=Danionella cerebrum TaxID=2873325 RepID=A0A553N2T7_9TELE|nr:hypothetical protein DNTS_017288 [Danionella translucida]